MTATKKKAASALAAVGVAAALALGGTFAWQSISQTALNEASDVVNPGGRLHDDFYIDDNGDYNADIYVENFADDEIFARVKLEEYMEVVVNYGTDAAITQTLVGTQGEVDGDNPNVVTDKDGNPLYERDYALYTFDGNEVVDAADVATGGYGAANDGETSWFSWTPGSAESAEVYYMPTFNKNKDSLVADRNGMYVDRIGGISNRSQDQYEDYTVYGASQEEPGTEIYDVDSNTADEVGYNFGNLATYVNAGNIKTVDETHAAEPVGKTNGLISMSEWFALLNDGEDTADYWVYDTDGWVYWSSPIAAGKTTGLLLDSIELNQVMDDTWYYAINAVGQFVTADDAGKTDGTGFYVDDDLDGEADSAPSAEAETLLAAIGVSIDGEESEPEISDQPLDITISYADGNLAGVPPTNPGTGKPADGVTQIFAIGIEGKDLHLGGTLTLDDGGVLSSANGDFDVAFTLDGYEANMVYTFGEAGEGDTEYSFTTSTIEDASSEYNGYKLVTCDQTDEKMMVLDEGTGHMVMLADDQPINQAVYVTAHATYGGVEYTSVENWVLYFVNRDIIMFIEPGDDSTPSYGASYTPGTASSYALRAELLFENEAVTDASLYPVEWKVLDADGNAVTDDSVVLNATGYEAKLTVTESASSASYRVVASYFHDDDDGKNKGMYTAGWVVAGNEYGGGEEGDGEESTLAMTFSSDPSYTEDGNGGACIEIARNREEDVKWNLWACSEGAFTLVSSNTAVTFEPYSEGDESNTDMNIVIPTSVTEDFTVTATATNNSGKSVAFTVKMVNNV